MKNVLLCMPTDCDLSMSLKSYTFPVINEVKDLGVVVDTFLTFHCHIDSDLFAFILLNLFLKCLLRVTSRTFRVLSMPETVSIREMNL